MFENSVIDKANTLTTGYSFIFVNGIYLHKTMYTYITYIFVVLQQVSDRHSISLYLSIYTEYHVFSSITVHTELAESLNVTFELQVTFKLFCGYILILTECSINIKPIIYKFIFQTPLISICASSGYH